MTNGVEQFAKAMDAKGYNPGEIVADGRLHRFSVNGKAADKAGYYVLYADGPVVAGAFGDWRSGDKFKWSEKYRSVMTERERSAYRKAMEQARKLREAERKKEQSNAQKRARSIWKKAQPVKDHPYLREKGVPSYGLSVHNNSIVMPLRDLDGQITTLQFINTDGSKIFLKDGKKRGSFFTIHGKGGKLFLCEGYATGATIYKATGGTVIVCADAGNLLPAAEAVHEKYPQDEIIICADNDRWTEGNPGIRKARAAAKQTKAKIAIPKFKDLSDKPTDFNDLYRLEGIDTVNEQVGLAKTQADLRPVLSFQLIHNAEIIKYLKPTEWLIQDILEPHALFQDFGDPGSFKTFAALDRLMSVASGTSYHGRKVKQGPTFLVAAEGQQGLGRRILAWHIAHGTKPKNVPFFISTVPAQLIEEDSLLALMQAFDGLREEYGDPVMVHFDTFARNMGAGDENSTADVGAVISNLDRYLGNGITRGFTHHTGHKNKDRARGAMALKAALDTEYRISGLPGNLVEVRCTKMKDAKMPETLYFAAEPVRLRIGEKNEDSIVLRMITSDVKGTCMSGLKGQQQQAVAILEGLYAQQRKNLERSGLNGSGAKVLINDWKQACQAAGLYTSRQGFHQARHRLENIGAILADETYVYLRCFEDDENAIC